jgi:hypothetical protein
MVSQTTTNLNWVYSDHKARLVERKMAREWAEAAKGQRQRDRGCMLTNKMSFKHFRDCQLFCFDLMESFDDEILLF